MGIALKRFTVQLSETQFGGAIIAAGGKCIVTKVGTPDPETLYDPITELAIVGNAITPIRGKIDFCVPVDRNAVDLYIQTPAGQFVTARNVIPSGDNEIVLHGLRREQTYVIPFSFLQGVNTEVRTGLIVPLTGLVQPYPYLRVTTQEGPRTISVGTLSTDGGVANGFIAAASLAAAGLVKASLINGSQTLGADLRVQDSANAGDLVPEQNVNKAGKEITFTLSASTAAAKGFIYLPVQLAA